MAELTEDERNRRRALAERIGVAPSAPGFELGATGRRAYTGGLRSPKSQLTPKAKRRGRAR